MTETIKLIRVLLLMVIQHGGDGVSCKRRIAQVSHTLQSRQSFKIFSRGEVKREREGLLKKARMSGHTKIYARDCQTFISVMWYICKNSRIFSFEFVCYLAT